ncbi:MULTISPECIES: aspartate ammonia-lyase [Gammaproteobacteria]|uniref:class II fumarate hydratase n=1 Tax=Gammaproteobacteria TaxID=1236 RepID=UPI000DCF8976|nr:MULTISPECIES: class II fumarate hydratase [Gammaproteobacteria]RTE87441.1 class II fumarate hydratase [Aliidiomarina sp. B3213]TCZ92774.1 class II fumarate hydratase [Lysobacter sp. N42]
MREFRTEKDSMGEVEVPSDALYGAQTQRALNNHNISELQLPFAFIRAVALIKYCAAEANSKLGVLDSEKADAIMQAALEVFEGRWQSQFPVDVFQTGSGTSTNMNVNEVLATLASRASGLTIHPNDDVNMGQSSNDVIPTAIQLSASRRITRKLLPALSHLREIIEKRASENETLVKTGRTHLMDAMPMTVAQELRAWAAQIESAEQRFEQMLPQLRALPQGGTAIGTGINAHPQFREEFCRSLSEFTECPYTPTHNPFSQIAGQDIAVATAGITSSLATALMKISNDLRWMNSGPLSGLGEASLKALQPGSSIMPGKVNPVIPESVAMACAQVFGNQTTINVAGQSGSFQLNVMLPVIAYNLLQSIELMTNSAISLADQCIASLTFNEKQLDKTVAKNPILVTALNSRVGYNKAAEIAKEAYKTGEPIIDVAARQTDISKAELESLLDPKNLTQPQQE